MFSVAHFRSYCFALFMFFTTWAVRAQYNDAGLWLRATIEKKIDQKLSISATPTIRFNENMTELYKHFVDLGASFKIIEDLKVGANYRLINQRELDDSYSMRHRFYIDLGYKYKIDPLGLSYRLRYQNQFKDIGKSEDWQSPASYLRNKLAVKYSTDGKIQPYVAGDLWFNLNERYYDNFRFTLGAEYEINKFSSVDVAYLINREFNVKNPVTSYIISLGYNYSF